MLASVTPLPVIGVPVPLKSPDGLDSLLSIVQMPAGVPVATVAVGGARNAGLLAVRILGAAGGPAARAPGQAGRLRRGSGRAGPRQGCRPARPGFLYRTVRVPPPDNAACPDNPNRTRVSSPGTLDK